VFPDANAERLITTEFFPVRAHIKRQPQVFRQFDVQWTPTQLILDPDGVERHRMQGFLPVEDFLGEVELGLVADAAQALRERYPDSEWTRKASVWGS
jgi:thioredoxin-related protein